MLGIIAAGGRGSRMNTLLPKPLTKLPNGETLLSAAINKLHEHVEEIVVVTSPSVLTNPSFVKDERCRYRVQLLSTGMGDAVFCAADLILQHEDLLITWCDQIGISDDTIDRSIQKHKSMGGSQKLTIPVLIKETSYIHFKIIEDRIREVLQAREGDLVPNPSISDVGLFIVSGGNQILSAWTNGGRDFSLGNHTTEYNFLPFLQYLNGIGWSLGQLDAVAVDGIGVNSQDEFKRALKELKF